VFSALLVNIVSVHAQTLPLITEYFIPSLPGDAFAGITNGPDGNLWFTVANGIDNITTAGVFTEYSGTVGSPLEITAGGDGNLWFTDAYYGSCGVSSCTTIYGLIGRITTLGVITEFQIPASNGFVPLPLAIALGPDGNLWFTEENQIGPPANGAIGKITPVGVITQYPISPTALPESIVAGADGNLWFADTGNNAIGKITPAGVITEYPISTANDGPTVVAKGPDGNVWFNENNGQIPKLGEISPAGNITEHPISQGAYVVLGIAAGPDGNIWYTDHNNYAVGRIAPAGTSTEFPVPLVFDLPGNTNTPGAITAGPDGNMWFVDANERIGRVTLNTQSNVTISAGFTGNWFEPAEAGYGFSIEVLPNNEMLAQWYVFAPNGGQSWIVATGPITGNTAVLQGYQPVGPGGRFPPSFNGSQLQKQPWGTITFTFTDCNDGTVSWQPTAAGYTNGSIPISRLTMPAGLTCP
jgi:streptogramin lyase